jgi:hypothetical protein
MEKGCFNKAPLENDAFPTFLPLAYMLTILQKKRFLLGEYTSFAALQKHNPGPWVTALMSMLLRSLLLK